MAWRHGFARPAIGLTLALRRRCGMLRLALSVGGLLGALPVWSQSHSVAEVLHFRQIDERAGLSQSTARALAQDDLGFVWVGTQDGLNRYDGLQSQRFRRDDGSGLTDSHILSLLVDGQDLWVGTQAGGLLRHRGLSDRFETVTGPWLDGVAMVPALAQDDQHLYAAVAGRGLLRLHKVSGEAALLDSPPSLRFVQSLDLHEGVLAVATRDELLWWPTQADAPKVLRFAAGQSPTVSVVRFADDGSLWVGLSEDGLRRVQAHGADVLVLDPEAVLSSPQVRSLLVDRRGRIWIGSEAGLTRFDPSTGLSVQAHHDPDSQTSLPANRIPALLEDAEGLIWAGTWTGGVGVYRPDSEAVQLYRRFVDVPASLPANPVRAVLAEDDGRLWLGVQEGGGLVHFDPQQGVLARYLHNAEDPFSLPDNRVEALLRRRDGSLWVGTGSGGLARMHADGRFERFRREADGSGALPSNAVISLYEDAEQTLWVGFADLGLVQRCASCSHFESLPLAEDSPVQQVLGRINQVLRTGDGHYWIAGMPNGLYRYDPQRQHLLRYSRQLDDPASPSHDAMTVLLEDSRGRLWAGTQGGGLLEVARDERGEAVGFRAITRADGLSGDAIGGVLEAPDGAIWAATISGLTRVDPLSGALRNLDASFGELARGYFIGAAAIGPDGVHYFGGLRGLTALRPTLMPPPRGLPALRLTGIGLDNTPISAVAVPGLPSQPVARTQRVLVPPGYGMVGVEFAALDYLAPAALRYEYRLRGLDDTWLSTPANRRFAAFTRLPAGQYQLELRVSRPGQEGNYAQHAVDIVVLAPLWRRPLALFAYALLALWLGYLFWRRYERRRERDLAAQLALRDSEERLKLALWGSGDELWDLDLADGRLHRENPLPGLVVSQHPPDSIEAYLEQVHDAEREAIRAAFLEHVRGQRDHYEFTYRGLATDGSWRWLLARGRSVRRDAQGHALRVAGTVRDVSESKANEDALKRFADELESRVEARTADHRLAIAQLKRTVEELTLTQRQLVESEKMASLGQLVAGVAHEINTPIGIGVTAASHLQHEATQLQLALREGRLGKTSLAHFVETATSSAHLVLANLARASDLVRSFKQVAVDQSSEQKRGFLLRGYLDEILLSLRPRLKRTRHEVEVECDPQLYLNTYPGALYQIIVNLVINSLVHAFEGIDQGHIRIRAEVDGAGLLLQYSDDGSGMDDATRQRIFDPFFTTRRTEGGSGLGMHLVFNLVTQRLKGTIECHSAPGQGVRFDLRMPGVVGRP